MSREKREKQILIARNIYEKRNLIEELEWEKWNFASGYINRQQELFYIWIIDECLTRLTSKQISLTEIRRLRNEMSKVEINTQGERNTLSTCLCMIDDLIEQYEEEK